MNKSMHIVLKIDRRNDKNLLPDEVQQTAQKLNKRLNKTHLGSEISTRFSTTTDIVITGISKEPSKLIK